MQKILLLEAHTIQATSIAKSLYKNGYHIISFCDEKFSYGYYTRYAHEKRLTPSCTKDPDKYYRYLLDYLRSEKIAAVLPMSDDSAALLSKHRETLSQYTAFAAPSYEVFENGYDKNKLMAACREMIFLILIPSTCQNISTCKP